MKFTRRAIPAEPGVALKLLRPSLRRHDPEPASGSSAKRGPSPRSTIPNIVTIHSVEEDDGVLFLTMELVDGRTLAR